MSINSINDAALYMRQQTCFYQQSSQVGGCIQGASSDGGSIGRIQHHQRSGMGHALMQTLKQLLQSLPPDSSSQGAAESIAEPDRRGEAPQVNAVRTDMHNFMHALFQAIRSQASVSPPGASGYPSGFDGTRFEDGLSGLVSKLTSGPVTDDAKISELLNAFNTLIQDLQNGASSGSTDQTPPSVTLQDFLTALQENLRTSQPSISASGNVVNVQG